MAIMRFNYRSQAVGHYMDITVVYPTDEFSYFDPKAKSGSIAHQVNLPGEESRSVYEPGMKFQTIYLIHGGGDDDTLTYRYTNAERYAQKNRVMLVTPGIPNSFGVDTEYGIGYSTFLTEELPVLIQSLFASSPEREDNFIMGYAMGGNIALGTALIRPDKYAACVDISGGIGMTLDTELLKQELDGDHFRNHFYLFNSSFGDSSKIDGSRFDLYQIAKKHKENGEELPKFHIACGSKEFIRKRVEGDVRLLGELGYDVDYILAEGYDHNWEMWDTYIRKAMDEILPLKRKAIYTK